MVQLCIRHATLLRTNLCKTPVSLLSQQLRYKSLTALIARGKEADNFAGPRRHDRRGARPDPFNSGSSYSRSRSTYEERIPKDFSKSNDSTQPRSRYDHKGGPSSFKKGGARPERGFEDKPLRDFGENGERSTRPRREFGDDRGPRPSFGADRESRPRRESGHDRGPRPSFGADRESRPRRESGHDSGTRASFGEGDRERRPRRESGHDRDTRASFGEGDKESRRPRESGHDRGTRASFGEGDKERRPRANYYSSKSQNHDGSRDYKPSQDSSKPRESGSSKMTARLDSYPGNESRPMPKPSKHYNTSRDSRSPREYNESAWDRLGERFKGSREPPEQEWDPAANFSKPERSGFKFSDTRMEDVSRTDYTIESLPYTTAASEFLYGHSSVLAAIKANRRKLYTLYIHTRGLHHDGIAAMIARATAVGLDVKEVDDKYLRAMDKASSGRPHNGFILEASPLPQPPISDLGPASLDGHFSVSLGRQSAEDAAINGKQTRYTYKSSGWRHPLFLYVDGVLDEGNLGAIARSAYFLGVDAIATPTRQSAPWSHIALKASAGAAEAIPIFTVASPADFLGKSSRQGWRIYASDAVPAEETKPVLTSPPSTAVTPDPPSDVRLNGTIVYTYARGTRRMPFDHSPVANHPTILMMGAEGAGLRSSLLNLAHYKVGIRHGRETNEVGVDSLNVSVAASLLCYDMMQKPVPEKKQTDLLF